MAPDPLSILSIVKEVVGFGLKIMGKLETAGHNAEDCRAIGELLRSLTAIAEHLKGTPRLMEDGGSMRDTTEGLEKALQRASKFVTKCKKKGFFSRAFKAKDVAERLRGVCLDLLLNLIAVLLASSVLNASMLADIKETVTQLRADVAGISENVAQLCADVAYTKSMFARILQIVVAHPDADLRKEVEKLVHAYQTSTEYASSSQKSKRDTKKTDGASPKKENKRETKKTDLDRPEVKIQKNNGLEDSKPPHASVSDAESVSVESVSRQHGSSNIINKASSSVYPLQVGKRVDEEQSVTVSAAPLQLQQIISASEVPGETGCYKIISRFENMPKVTSIDVHPSNTWIVVGHKRGNFSIWDYQKKKTVMERQVNEVPGKAARLIHGISGIFMETPVPHSVCSVKFIAQEKWLVVGNGDGYIYVYDYSGTKLHEVERFEAHEKSVDSLAVHPTEPYLLSSSAFGREIKLWDWRRGWVKIKEFDVKPITSTYDIGVRSVKFNLRDTNTFACVAFDNSVKVGNIIKSSSLETKLTGPSNADYFFTRSHQHLMVTLSSDSHNSEIRDLETGKVVRTLCVSGHKMSRVSCHPTLPILATTLDDGTVCLWDADTYRLEERVHIMDSKCRDLVFVTDTNGLTRLVVTSKTKIVIMEVNLPIANTIKQIGSRNYG